MFNLTFENPRELQVASANIIRAYNSVKAHNELYAKGEANYTRTLYKFSHLSESQFMKMYGGLKLEAPVLSSQYSAWNDATECDNLPEYKNWVQEGKVGQVMDQSPCGSCYMMSAITALESATTIETGKKIQLSKQHMLECYKKYRNAKTSCSGGYPTTIWDYAKEMKGLVLESAYKPYNANDAGTCVEGLSREPSSEVDYWSNFGGDEEAMKCRVAKYGPLVVTYRISGTSMSTYHNGVFDDLEKVCKPGIGIDHASVIVGYGTELTPKGKKIDYWIVQNSWGSSWADKGFVKVVRGRNLCKIADYALGVVVKSKKEKILKPIAPPSTCTNIGDIFSGTIYQKSFCLVRQAIDYNAARINCDKNGMRLFSPNTPEANQVIQNTSSRNLESSGAYLWGISDQGCSIFENLYGFVVGNCSLNRYYFCEFINIERKF